MAINSALETLIELATNQTDEAAKRLGRAVRACEDTEQKLVLLLQYRDDYEAKFKTGLSNGISAAGYRNFQLFLDKLDTAIAGQQQIVEDASGASSMNVAFGKPASANVCRLIRSPPGRSRWNYARKTSATRN